MEEDDHGKMMKKKPLMMVGSPKARSYSFLTDDEAEINLFIKGNSSNDDDDDDDDVHRKKTANSLPNRSPSSGLLISSKPNKEKEFQMLDLNQGTTPLERRLSALHLAKGLLNGEYELSSPKDASMIPPLPGGSIGLSSIANSPNAILQSSWHRNAVAELSTTTPTVTKPIPMINSDGKKKNKKKTQTNNKNNNNNNVFGSLMSESSASESESEAQDRSISTSPGYALRMDKLLRSATPIVSKSNNNNNNNVNNDDGDDGWNSVSSNKKKTNISRTVTPSSNKPEPEVAPSMFDMDEDYDGNGASIDDLYYEQIGKNNRRSGGGGSGKRSNTYKAAMKRTYQVQKRDVQRSGS